MEAINSTQGSDCQVYYEEAELEGKKNNGENSVNRQVVHWTKMNRAQVTKVVRNIREIYKKSIEQAPKSGFIISINTTKNFKVDVKAANTTKLPRCSQMNQCGLCKSPNQTEVEPATNKHHFFIVKSLSKRMLIIDKKSRSLDWTEMSEKSQIKMILAAQKAVARFQSEVKNIAGGHNVVPELSELEFHCKRTGSQTVGHTHGRINRLMKKPGAKPSHHLWTAFFSAAKKKSA